MAIGGDIFIILVPIACVVGLLSYGYWRRVRQCHQQWLVIEAAPGEYVYFDLERKSVHGAQGGLCYGNAASPNIKTIEQFFAFLGNSASLFERGFAVLKAKKKKSLSYTLTIESRMYHARICAIENEWSEVSGIICWFFDITAYEEQAAQILASGDVVKEKKRRLNTIYGQLPIPVWCKDKSGEIVYKNQQFDEIIEPNSYVLERLEEHLRDHGNTKALNESLVVEGKQRNFDLNEKSLLGVPMTMGYALEMTLVKEKEAELRNYDQLNAQLLSSSSSAMAVYGKNMRLAQYNDAFVKLWGLKEAWLDTQPTYAEILEVLRKARKIPEQADYNKFRNTQIDLFQNLIEPYEDFYYLPSGKTVRVMVVPHALGGVLFAYEDLTDNIKMERSYNTLIAVQKETLDHLNEAILTLGEDGHVELYNPKYIELWPGCEEALKEKVHYSRLVEFSKPFVEGEEKWLEMKQQLMEQTNSRIFTTMRIARTDGKVVDRTSIPLPDGATLISYVDVTDSTLLERSLRERNEALEEADRIKVDFLANISYEFRTPLTSILGLTDVLKKQLYGSLNDQQSSYVDDIQSASSQLLVLINDVLEMATIEAGYMTLDKTRHRVDNLLHALLPVLQEKAKEKRLRLSLQCDNVKGEIEVDERRFKQVVFNMFNHAFAESEVGGKVVITAEDEGAEVAIRIRDNGKGLTARQSEKIFDRFFQLNEEKGIGGGLFVAKHIVELHQGRVSVESELQEGTTVCCYFKRLGAEVVKIAI